MGPLIRCSREPVLYENQKMFSVSSRFVIPSLRAFSTVRDIEICSKGFDEIIRARNSCRKYKNQDIDKDIMNHVLSQTITAPTARNWQPYKIVIMKEKSNLAKLSTFMPEKNAKVILQVPAVAIFLADCEPASMGAEFGKLWEKQGLDMTKVPNILSGFSYTVGNGGMTGLLTKCTLKQKSNKDFAPEFYTNREWSIKQSVFPMELFTLSCQAHGLSSMIMEGFDGRHIRELIGCSKRYFVTGVVPFGYSAEEGVKPTLRYNTEDMVFEEKFGSKMIGIPEYNRNNSIVC